ncbi:NADPH-dependent FMN reductase [Stenotrophomonas indicatrix]|jgi:chromate reductase|uniref:NADPH-dependent FMN reductase n=1 Tax=Stenotrophomonas indicatrix TaxID=2045451 RepID=UPI003444FBD6
MKILALSGSARRLSTNTALLRALEEIAPPDIALSTYAGLGGLPVFSPDLEDLPLPDSVVHFKRCIEACDGILISSPEYARGIPGGLKNAIDWLVSGDLVIAKPIALVHASHRGDDMLASLRLVLSTISSRFNEELFLRFPFMKMEPEAIADAVRQPVNRGPAEAFLQEFFRYCQRPEGD